MLYVYTYYMHKSVLLINEKMDTHFWRLVLLHMTDLKQAVYNVHVLYNEESSYHMAH